MAHGAALFCLNGPAFGMPVKKIRSMIGRFQVGALVVTLHAAKWGIDFVMANEAIGHTWKCRGGNLIRVVERAVAGSA